MFKAPAIPDHSNRAIRPWLLAALLSPAALACFEVPELDQELPPIPDLGAIDTWAGIDDAGPGVGDDGPWSDSGPSGDSAGSDSGGGPGGGDGGGGDGGDGGDGGVDPNDPALAQLLLSEVLADPDGKDGAPDSPEVVEISNPGPLPVKLDGLRVKGTSWPTTDSAKLGLEGLVLEPGGVLVIRRWTTDGDPNMTALVIDGSVMWTGLLSSGALRNKDGIITIEFGTTLIDQLVYGLDLAEPSPGWSGPAVPASGSGKSLCRREGPDHDDATDWSSCTPNPGVFGAGPTKPSPIAPGALQVVEIHANPPVPESQKKSYQFVEIINNSQDQIELGGCRIGDHPSIDAPGLDPLEYAGGDGGCDSPTCLAPGARAIIVGQGYLGEAGGALVLATDDASIANSGLTNIEPVVLWDGHGNMVSSYRLWSDPAGDPLPLDNQPLHRIAVDTPDEPPSWISAPPTPGY